MKRQTGEGRRNSKDLAREGGKEGRKGRGLGQEVGDEKIAMEEVRRRKEGVEGGNGKKANHLEEKRNDEGYGGEKY